MIYRLQIKEIESLTDGIIIHGLWTGSLPSIGDLVTVLQSSHAPFNAVISNFQTEELEDQSTRVHIQFRELTISQISEKELIISLGEVSGFIQEDDHVRGLFGRDPSLLAITQQVFKAIENYILDEDILSASKVLFIFTKTSRVERPQAQRIADFILITELPLIEPWDKTEVIGSLSKPLSLIYDELDPGYDDDDFGLMSDLLMYM